MARKALTCASRGPGVLGVNARVRPLAAFARGAPPACTSLPAAARRLGKGRFATASKVTMVTRVEGPSGPASASGSLAAAATATGLSKSIASYRKANLSRFKGTW